MSGDVKSKKARIYRGTMRNIARLARALQDGELVAVPTETVYGLAADALNAAACRKIFKAKGRPTNDPLIVHIHALRQLDELAERNDAVEKLARAFWPGPLTMVLPKKAVVPDLVTSGRPSVAVRMPKHRLFLALLRQCGRPLAAPSANPFGYISPTTAMHVRDSLGGKIAYILEGGDAEIGLESTIVDLRDPKTPRVLRPGAISAAQIGKVLGRRVTTVARNAGDARSGAAGAGEIAPGMLSKHYSPRTAITLHARLSEEVVKTLPADEAAVFVFKPVKDASAVVRVGVRKRKTEEKAKNVFWLSERGDLRRAARSLFGVLRALDSGRWKRIHVELTPGADGFALAINDRLTRAAAKRIEG